MENALENAEQEKELERLQLKNKARPDESGFGSYTTVFSSTLHSALPFGKLTVT